MNTFYKVWRKLARIRIKSDFPKLVEIDDLVEQPLRFRINSSIENHRIVHFGGEREVLERFLAQLKSTDILYDIGASVGLYTISAASIMIQGQILSFEPDPETRRFLRVNLELNQFRNVDLVAWAVGDKDGESMLFTDGANGFAPSLRRQKRVGAPQNSVMIPVKTLDQAIQSGELPKPDVIKLDVEGAETLCLKGSEKLLRGKFNKKPRLVFIELHPDFLPDFNSSTTEVYNSMEDFGYRSSWSEYRDSQEHVFFTPIENVFPG